MLLADRSDLGLGRRHHARHRLRHAGHVHEGKETVGIRLSWDKRYITLGPKATLVGLAFRLFDPENLLGKGEDIGITRRAGPGRPSRRATSAAAICRRAPRSRTGPNWGKRRLHSDGLGDRRREDGRPGLAHADGMPRRRPRHLAAVVRHRRRQGACCASRRAYAPHPQAVRPARRRDGRASRSRSRAWSRRPTSTRRRAASRPPWCSRGEKPSVISALMKYQTTERMRRSVNDAMDIHGGRAICDGPTNYLQSAYQMVPVGITVEGANILTRTLITFAQGALRSHPYLYKEIQAGAGPGRASAGLDAFDAAFCGHVAFSLSNVARRASSTTSPAARSRAAPEQAPTARPTGTASCGGPVAQLRLRRRPDGRRCSAAASRPSRSSRAASPMRSPSSTAVAACSSATRTTASPPNDRHIVALAAQNGLYRFQEALRGTIDNFPVAPARWLMRVVVFPLGSPLQAGARLARPQGRRARARARRGARSAHPLSSSSRRTSTIRPACSR